MRILFRRALCLALLSYAPLLNAQPHFAACLTPTGTNASVIVPDAAHVTTHPGSGASTPIEVGDEIAIVTSDGLCVAAATWGAAGMALAVWGDDPQTDEQDGLLPGDTLIYRAWDASAGQELNATAVTYDELFDTSGLFSPDAVLFIATLTFGEGMPVNGEEGTLNGLAFALEPNYPNPFRDRTTLAYTLTEPGRVRLDIYDLLGRRVATVVDEDQAPGRHEAFFDVPDLASGAYLARLVAGNQSATQRLQVVR